MPEYLIGDKLWGLSYFQQEMNMRTKVKIGFCGTIRVLGRRQVFGNKTIIDKIENGNVRHDEDWRIKSKTLEILNSYYNVEDVDVKRQKLSQLEEKHFDSANIPSRQH